MTAKEYCINNKAIAIHHTLYMQIHGVINCVDGDVVYLAERVYINAFGKKAYKFHRCKVRYYADNTPYIRVYSTHWDGSRQSQNITLDNFIRIGTWVNYPYFTAEELAA